MCGKTMHAFGTQISDMIMTNYGCVKRGTVTKKTYMHYDLLNNWNISTVFNGF
jgi:hypothetical protein